MTNAIVPKKASKPPRKNASRKLGRDEEEGVFVFVVDVDVV
jgi:hypothetical protein